MTNLILGIILVVPAGLILTLGLIADRDWAVEIAQLLVIFSFAVGLLLIISHFTQ